MLHDTSPLTPLARIPDAVKVGAACSCAFRARERGTSPRPWDARPGLRDGGGGLVILHLVAWDTRRAGGLG
ncbi:hypothetical protein IMZ48_39320 [Candidatus Bathyarchaeota archaeon]|nr:hypothetical protein [Candidatus Bathyarchaeota archaeon]